jgi:hypothetical protein
MMNKKMGLQKMIRHNTPRPVPAASAGSLSGRRLRGCAGTKHTAASVCRAAPGCARCPPGAAAGRQPDWQTPWCAFRRRHRSCVLRVARRTLERGRVHVLAWAVVQGLENSASEAAAAAARDDVEGCGVMVGRCRRACLCCDEVRRDAERGHVGGARRRDFRDWFLPLLCFKRMKGRRGAFWLSTASGCEVSHDPWLHLQATRPHAPGCQTSVNLISSMLKFQSTWIYHGLVSMDLWMLCGFVDLWTRFDRLV